MKYTIKQIKTGEDELILNYQEMNPEIENIIAFMQKKQKTLIGRVGDETVVFAPDDILYIEKVDDKTFVYTDKKVIQIDMTLTRVELVLEDDKYFRCSKSMIVNVDKVNRLKSLPSNRIDACLINGEHIIISRSYASDFRRLLRGE